MNGNVDTGKNLRIWIAEGDNDYLRSLKALVEDEKNMSCDAAFEDVNSVLSALQSLSGHLLPDIILFDVHMAEKSGADGIGQIISLSPGSSVIVMSVDEETDLTYRAFQSGAFGYLSKDSPSDTILQVIRQVERGVTLMPSAVAEKVLDHFRSQKSTEEKYGLSSREKEVLVWMSKGISQKKIAEKMFLSPYTVNSHVQKIYLKLQVNSGIAAIVKALREKII